MFVKSKCQIKMELTIYAVVERFLESLKHDWVFKIAQPTREHMRKDVAAYMRYYNPERRHTENGDQSASK